MLRLTAPALRQIWPRAPQTVIDAFIARHALMDAAGITATRERLGIFLSQIEHECGGFTIANLTENINYSAERAAQIWPSRFASAAAVRSKYGTAPGWQRKMFDDVYGNRMGNRPGTNDGSRYIGRGGPQLTGRDGYREIGKRIGVDLEAAPERAAEHALQPDICVAFWSWKNLNPVADGGGLRAVTKIWNGGYVGMADREAQLAGNSPIILRLQTLERVSAGPPARSGTVTASVLNLRTSPHGAIVRTLAQGARVQIDSQDGDWLGVTTADGARGYVAARYVET